VPRAPPLSKKEDKQVTYFLLFREHCHDGPLYTQARTWSKRQRTYGQDQVNMRYGQTSKATIDPFLAVPTYSQKFQQPKRALPDLTARPFALQFFPKELHDVLDDKDIPAGPPRKRRRTDNRRLVLSNKTSLQTADDVFGTNETGGTVGLGTALQVINSLEKRAEDEDDGFLSGDDDDDWVKDNGDDEDGNVEDPDQYNEDDESDNDDYNAEQYFDGNQEDDDYDDGGGDDGAYM